MNNKTRKYITAIVHSDIFKNIKTIITLDGINTYAPAALSFYMILSFIPCLILIEVILSIINLTLNQNFSFLSYFFSSDQNVSNSIKEIISSITTGGLISLGISFSVIIYLASKGLTFFQSQIKKMYKIEVVKTSFLKNKTLSIGTTLILLLIFSLFAVFLIIFGNILSFFSEYITYIFSYIFTAILLVFFIMFLYYFTSKVGRKRDHFLGSLFSTLSICIGIILYYLYLINVSKSLSYYGPLSSISLLCLIFFYSSYILFMGIEINKINFQKQEKNR